MGARSRHTLAAALLGAPFACSSSSEDNDPFALGPPGGWDQNGYWNSTFTPFVPASSPDWPGPRLAHETFNANNHLVIDPRSSASPCHTTTPVTIRGSRFEADVGIGPSIWREDEQRWLLPGESVTYSATLRNDAGWSMPVTFSVVRMQDLSVESIEGIVSPTFDVTMTRDSDCAAAHLGINQIGPVPRVTTHTAQLDAATGSYAFYKTYFAGQERTEAVPAKVMVNAGLLQPLGEEPDDLYETCDTHRPVAASAVLFNASYALAAMTWSDVVGSQTLDTGVQMTVPGQRVRIHLLAHGERVCYRQWFPGREIVRLAPPDFGEPDPTLIDVVQVEEPAFLAGEQPVTAGHHALHGRSYTRTQAWLSASADPDRFTYRSMRDTRVRATRVDWLNGTVGSWGEVKQLLAATLATGARRAALVAAAETAPVGGTPPSGYLEEPADQSRANDWCGNGYCWSGETPATCPVDCAPPPPPMPSPADAGMTDAPIDAGVDAMNDAAIDAPAEAGTDGPTPAFDGGV